MAKASRQMVIMRKKRKIERRQPTILMFVRMLLGLVPGMIVLMSAVLSGVIMVVPLR